MQILINGEDVFQILSDSFSVSPSAEGYVLQISADGTNFSDLFTVAANTTRMVTGVANGSYYKLYGNNSEVTVNWQKTCGGSSTLPVATTTNLGGVIIGSGINVDSYGTISVDGSSYTLPIASDSTLGGVKIGSGVTIDSDGVISVTDNNLIVTDNLSSTEAQSAANGSFVGLYVAPSTQYVEFLTSGDAGTDTIKIDGDVDFAATLYVYIADADHYITFTRSNGKFTAYNYGDANGQWYADGENVGYGSTGATITADVFELKNSESEYIRFTKDENGDYIGSILGGTNPHFRYVTVSSGNNGITYPTAVPASYDFYQKVEENGSSVFKNVNAAKLNAVSELPASANNGDTVAWNMVQIDVTGDVIDTEGFIAYMDAFDNGNIQFSMYGDNDSSIMVSNGELTTGGWVITTSTFIDGDYLYWGSDTSNYIVRIKKESDKFVLERGNYGLDSNFAILSPSAYTYGNGVFQYNGATWDKVGDYTLPIATADTLGGVKIGSGLSISDGVVSVIEKDITKLTHIYELPEVSDIGDVYAIYSPAHPNWVNFDASQNPTEVMIDTAKNNGEYLMHFNSDNSFFGIAITDNGVNNNWGGTVVVAGREWLYDDGTYTVEFTYNPDNGYFVGEITSGNTSFSMLDAYGQGQGNYMSDGTTVAEQFGVKQANGSVPQISWNDYDWGETGWTHYKFNKNADNYAGYIMENNVYFHTDWSAANQAYGGDNFNGWTVTYDGLNFTATKDSYTAVGTSDGDYIEIALPLPVIERYEGFPPSTQVGYDIDAATYTNLVSSTDVNKIVKLTQAQYDALAVKDSATVYIIISE